MRIAYVCTDPGVPAFGRKGCSIHVQEVVRAFVRLGHEVTLLARRTDGPPPPNLAGVPVVQLPGVAAGDCATREHGLTLTNWELPALLDGHGPFDLVYERFALWSSAALERAQSAGIPSVLEVNAPLVEEQARHRELVAREQAEQISAAAFSAATHIVAVSSGVADWLGGIGVDPDKIVVIGNGVDPARFMPERHSGGTVPVIGFVGTLKPWHGLQVLIEAAARLQDRGTAFGLLLVGDGPERASIEAAIADRGLAGRVRQAGAVDPAEVPALLAEMDIAVAPYPDIDGFYFSPLKIMEYMAAGRAVVASRIGDIEHLVADGRTGRLCPPGDAEALAEVLDGLLRDPGQRARLGAAAREHAVEELGWDSVAGRILGRVMQGDAC